MSVQTIITVVIVLVLGFMAWNVLPNATINSPYIESHRTIAKLCLSTLFLRCVGIGAMLYHLFIAFVYVDAHAWYEHLGWVFVLGVVTVEMRFSGLLIDREAELRARAEAPKIS
jgi:hypothetical protein